MRLDNFVNIRQQKALWFRARIVSEQVWIVEEPFKCERRAETSVWAATLMFVSSFDKRLPTSKVSSHSLCLLFDLEPWINQMTPLSSPRRLLGYDVITTRPSY